MTTINIHVELDEEQMSSITNRASSNDPPLSAAKYLSSIVYSQIALFVETDFNAAVERLRIGAKSLPFEQRIALIEQVEQAISTS